MTIRHVALRLVDQYLDSFLYSGTLFLLGKDGALTYFDWQKLILSTLSAHNRLDLADLFLDSRRVAGLTVDENSFELEIPSACLRDSETGSIQREIWPTDLNVYASQLYLSDEKGVCVIPFVYQTKSLDSRALRWIKSGYVYSITPGEGGRLAIAGVEDGLSLLVANGSNYSQRILVEDDIFDCDWSGTTLVANSSSHAYVTIFSPLPKREHFVDFQEFRSSLRRAKNEDPVTQVSDLSSPHEYRWLAGAAVVTDEPMTGFPGSQADLRIIKARSASFGSVIEYSDRIVVRRSNYWNVLEVKEPIFWRTFARSKNYLNQLHICDERGLQFRAYEMRTAESDRFAIELDDVDA